MDPHEAQSRLRDLPGPPRRGFTPLDLVLIIGSPLLAYAGGVLATQGSAVGVVGVVLTGVAGLLAVTIRAIRLSRTDEPVLRPFTLHVGTVASVLMLLVAFTLFRTAPHDAAVVTFGAPLVGVAVYAVYLAVLFWLRRR